MEQYTLRHKLGEGAFSEVHACQCSKTQQLYACKRVFLKDASAARFPVMPFRELQAHRTMADAARVVPVHAHFVDAGCLALIQPLYAADMSSVLDELVGQGRYSTAGSGGGGGEGGAALARSGLTVHAVRAIAKDMLIGIGELHAMGLMHRDVKPSNLFVTTRGRVDVGDLGLVRPFARCETSHTAALDWHYTAQVTSRWYRAPEILLGSDRYGPAIDAWAAGAVLYELCTGVPLAAGGSDIEQLCKVFAVRGTPDATVWPSVVDLPDWDKISFDSREAVPWRSLLPAQEEFLPGFEYLWQLLDGLLALDPLRRLSAEQALASPWFIACTCGTGQASARAGDEEGYQELQGLVARIEAARLVRAEQKQQWQERQMETGPDGLHRQGEGGDTDWAQGLSDDEQAADEGKD